MPRLSRFQAMPLMNAAWYEPVRSNTLPDIQPPSAMPNRCTSARADPRASLGRRKVLADDDRVRRHDPALEQAEQRRDDVERDQRIERQEQRQRGALQQRAEQKRPEAADAVADPARGAARALRADQYPLDRELGEIEEWLTYDIPRDIVGQAWEENIGGQTQKWYAPAVHQILPSAGGHDPEFVNGGGNRSKTFRK